MKKVGITYEITRRYYEEFTVTDEEYDNIHKGSIPDEILNRLEDRIDYGSRDDDWSAVNEETGEVIWDWR